jgi:hypothetical protein
MLKIARVITVLAVAAMMTLVAVMPATAAEPVERPFKGVLVGVATLVPDAGCPFGVRTDSRGSGQVTHFGLTSMTASHCTQFLGAPATGIQTFVAANGDMLEVTYTLTGEPFEPVEGAVMTGHGQTVDTGGTGRFAQASGEFVVHFRGILHLTAPMELSWWWDGEITY